MKYLFCVLLLVVLTGCAGKDTVLRNVDEIMEYDFEDDSSYLDFSELVYELTENFDAKINHGA